MRKIKNLDVQDIKQQVDSTKDFISKTKETVEQVKQALNGITTLHDGFAGNTADSIRSFYEEAHKPFLEFMESFLIQYEEALSSVNEQVLSFEPNENGFIRQEFLEGELTIKMQKAQDSLSATTDMINQQLNSVSDLASVSHVKDDAFQDSVAEAKKRINNTVDNMYEMDSNATSKLDKSEDDMQQLKTYVSKLKSAIDKNNITVDNFNVTQFNSEFFSYHNEFKLMARGRNALATGEKTEITQDEFSSLFPFVKNTEPVMDYYNERNGSYHTLKDGRIIREYPTQDGPRFEFVDKIPNPRASQPSDETNIVMDILGPVWKDTVNYFTEDFVTLFDSESSWWERGLGAAFIVPWGKGIKSEFKFGVKKRLDDIRSILNSKAPKSKRFKAGLSLLTPPNPGQQAFQFGEKYIKPVLLKNGGFLAKKVDGGKGKSNYKGPGKTKETRNEKNSPYVKRFKGDEATIHFEKHSKEVKDALGKKQYNLKNYLQDANHVIETGKYVPELNGYVKLVGGKGSAKYAFVGLDRKTGNITTFHIKSVKELSRKAPSLELKTKKSKR
nr:LXG domain-containing protein [Terribacillus saccharophilus]